jgi:tetratricopeptide (TPR) repeat protein
MEAYRQSFSYWVTNPNELGIKDVESLISLVNQYPYCQMLHTLAAKAATQVDAPQVTQLLPKAAIYALNRNALRKLIQNEFEWAPGLLSKLTDLPHHHHTNREHIVPYGNDKPISLVHFENRFGKLDSSSTPDTFTEKPLDVPPVDETVMLEKVVEDELTHKKLKTALTPPIELLPSSEPKEDIFSKQQEIIFKFIKNEPRIGPIRAINAEQQETIDLGSRVAPTISEGIATEAMAKILVKQGKFERAREMYEKLLLKNPEKKEYFAKILTELP